MLNIKKRYKQSLTGNVLSGLLISLLITSLLLIGVSYYISRNMIHRDMEKNSEEAINSFKEIITVPLWNMDKETLEYIGNTFLKNREIYYIRVVNRDGAYLIDQQSSDTKSGKLIDKTERVLFNNEYIGDVSIGFSSSNYESVNNKAFFTIVLIVFIITMLLGLVIRYQLKRKLQGPLEEVRRVVAAISEGRLHNKYDSVTYKEFDPLFLALKNMNKTITWQIKDLRSAEEKYRRLLDNLSSSFLFRYIPGDSFVFVSSSVRRVLGYDPEDFKKRFVLFLTEDDENLSYKAHLLENNLEVDSTHCFEVEVYNSAHEKKWLEITEFPVYNDSGELITIEGLAYDISRRKNIEREVYEINKDLENRVSDRTAQLVEANNHLEKAIKNAEEANGAKTSFLANISHELRNPINAIMGVTQLLQSGKKLPVHVQESIDIISNAVTHILSLIRDVLDISKIESSRAAIIHKENFNLHKMCDEVADMISVKADAKGLEFNSMVSEAIPQMVYSDKRRIVQILLNILGNSIKFTREGSVTLNTTIVKEDLYRFEIRDTGPGIRKTDIKNLFDPFMQSNSDPNLAHEGAGLGLYISKQLAKLLGGTLVVESELGKGALFILEIPLEKPIETEISEGIEIKDLKKWERYRGDSSIKVLVVEDDPVNRSILKSFMKKSGYTVKTAENGIDGVKIFKEFKPDLVWMDMRMPVMNGIDASKSIREIEQGPEKSIMIAVSANAFEEDQKKMLDAGCNDFVSKPYEINTIFEMIEKHLGERLNEIAKKKEIKKESVKGKLEGRKVLVADDDKVNTMVFTRLLDSRKFKTVAVNDPLMVLPIVKKEMPDIIFLDINMPIVSGYDVLKELKSTAQTSDIPIIMISGYDAEEDKSKSIDLGAADLIGKPFVLDDVVEKIRELI